MAKYKAIEDEAPDPLEYAVKHKQEAQPTQESPAETGIPGVGDPMANALAMIAQALSAINTKDASSAKTLEVIERMLVEQEHRNPKENLFNPPLVSHYNPLGERDHPRPELNTKFIYTGYELRKDGLLRYEIELLNQLKPGVYPVRKADGKIIKFTVVEKLNDNGDREMMTISFPCKDREHSQNHGSMISYLEQALGTAVPSVDQLRDEIAALKAQLGAK